MKHPDNQDENIKRRLKQESYEAGENSWFTPRVLNRLPEREHSLQHRWWAMCIVAAVACIGCWWWLIQSKDHLVLTVRDIVEYASMGIATMILIWQSIAVTLKRE